MVSCYEGEADTITVAFKKPKHGELTTAQKAHNKTHNGTPALGERGNSLLKTTFTSAAQHQPLPTTHRKAAWYPSMAALTTGALDQLRCSSTPSRRRVWRGGNAG